MGIEDLKVKLLRRLMAKDAIIWARRNNKYPSYEALQEVRDWISERSPNADQQPLR